MVKIFGFILVLGFFSAGCSSTASDNVKTSGIYASYSVDGNSISTATCTVILRVGGVTGTYLDLSASDQLTCDGQAMSKSSLLGIITYSASVSYSVGKSYEIVLTRSGETPYSSTVSLPEAVNITSPTSGTSFSKGSAITTTWSLPTTTAGGAYVSISASSGGSSYSKNYSQTNELGTYTFAATDSQSESMPVGSWSGTIQVQRYISGTLASGLSGTILGTQSKSVAITLN